MRKILVDFPEEEIVEFEFGDRTVKVEGYISIENKRLLIETYLDTYFNSDKENRLAGLTSNGFGASLVWDVALLDVLTNIKVDSKKISLDDLYRSGLISQVKNSISNYWEVEAERNRILREAVGERNSISGIISEVIRGIENLDFDKVKELGEQVVQLQNSISESPIASLIDEGKGS